MWTILWARSVKYTRRNYDTYKHRIEKVQEYTASSIIVPHTTKHVEGGVSEINALRDWNPTLLVQPFPRTDMALQTL